MIRSNRDATEFFPFMAYGGLGAFKIDENSLWDMWKGDAALRRYFSMSKVSEGCDLDASL